MTSTVKFYLAAVQHAQIALGLEIGGMPQLQYVPKGLCKKDGEQIKTNLPSCHSPPHPDLAPAEDGMGAVVPADTIQSHGALGLPGHTSRKHIPT